MCSAGNEEALERDQSLFARSFNTLLQFRNDTIEFLGQACRSDCPDGHPVEALSGIKIEFVDASPDR